MTNASKSWACKSLIRRLAANARGAAVIEYAIAAPFLILIMVGTIDLSRAFAAKTRLHAALSRTLEMAQLGTGDGSYDYLVAEAASAAGVPEEKVTLDKWIECDGTKKDYEETCASGEETARYLELSIESDYTPMFDGAVFGTNFVGGLVDISVSDTLRVQ